MEKPLGFVNQIHDDKVYLLDKGLYGLHQSPRSWYETLPRHLLDNGFIWRTVDRTLVTKEVVGRLMIVQVDVDDIIFGPTNNLCKEFEVVMKSEFEMSAMGEMMFFPWNSETLTLWYFHSPNEVCQWHPSKVKHCWFNYNQCSATIESWNWSWSHPEKVDQTL